MMGRVDDLAPDITRQRLLIEGYYTIDVDEPVIERYFSTLTSALSLRAYGSPTIFAPGGSGREENQGYDAFIPLIDSGISLYVWTGPRFLSVVVFTCKRFDAGLAIEVTGSFFGLSRSAYQEF
jgi:S-adenosylmethionine decarboxylase